MGYEKLANFIVNHYKRILLIALIVTIISLILSLNLKVDPGMLSLLPSNDLYLKTYKKATKYFNGVDSVILVAEGKNIKQYFETLAPVLKKLDNVEEVLYKMPVDFLLRNIFLLSDKNEAELILSLLNSGSLEDFFKNLNTLKFKGEIDQEKAKIFFNELSSIIENMLNDNPNGVYQHVKQLFYGEEYFLSEDGKMGMLIVTPSIDTNNVYQIAEFVNNIEKIAKNLAQQYGIKAGLTGSLVIARDEMVVTTKDTTYATILSITLIILIFIAGFKAIRYTILATVPLVLGIIWTLGIITLTLKELNIMTMMMAAILFGLGIDYSIHIISIFVEYRKKGKNAAEAVKEVFSRVIKGVIAGALTTAIGFIMFIVSDSPAFKEFGVVLALGIILTLFAAIYVLPSLLLVFDKKIKNKTIPQKKKDFNFLKFRTLYLVVSLLIFIISVLKIGDVQFEKDMLQIEPKGLESVELNKVLVKKFNLSPDSTMFITKGLKDTRNLYNELKKYDTFSFIDSIAPLLPETNKQIERMNYAKSKLEKLPYRSTINKNSLTREILKLNGALITETIALRAMGLNKLADEIATFRKKINLSRLANLPSEKLLTYQNAMIKALKEIRSKLNLSQIITLNDLPEYYKLNYIGKDDMFLTAAYPSGDMWDMDFQQKFLKTLKKLSVKETTGSALIFLKVMEIAINDGKKVIMLTITLIFVLLLIDFKSLKYAIITIIPLIFSVIVLLGIMGWFGIKFNPVNVIVLPLIIGIGIDDGIHFVHRYKREKDLNLALFSTGKAITMTTLTTAAAFGSLMIAKYRGFVSFGMLLFIGIFLCYLATIFIVPSIISIWRDKNENS
ncbi:MMPL family transporter [Thermosipho ferrireducens]|uniref:MMPL family transporter n=1 Tax=Thermosipho ferrireducens TaxID=2571116 RepID=A0ABX7S7B7_9BACT|nr:efflux RND transporter permease subunit [Thermosipho ferrireducens]QTA37685.1 MMPL family transporter [Thermosipho ferrireducens]